jgi:hypothetical protein
LIKLKKDKMTTTLFFSMILGLLLLFFGRRLFWLFVGVAGFTAGLTLVPQLLSGQSELAILVIAIIAGIIGAFLAVILEGLAILIAGFLAGGYLLTTFIVHIGISVSVDPTLLYIIGGITGLLLVALLFDWAIIILSTLLGAEILIQFLQLSGSFYWLVFIGLVAVGTAVQAGIWRRRYPVKRTWGRRPWY